jgi:Tol biopolymer transport system component
MKLLWILLGIVLVMALVLALHLADISSTPSSSPAQSSTTPPTKAGAAQVPTPAQKPAAVPQQPVSSTSTSPKPGLNVPYKIAFLVGRQEMTSPNDTWLINNTYDIYTINADGANQMQVGSTDFGSSQENLEIRPFWSPDGTKIAFLNSIFSADGKNKWRIEAETCTPSGGSLTNSSVKCFQGSKQISWAPDSRRVAFNGNSDKHTEVYISDFDGSKQKLLTDNPSYNGEPSWSPDGSKIAFFTGRFGAPGYLDDNILSNICLVDADGGAQVKLTDVLWGCDRAIWSPDSTQIAYMENYKNLYVLNMFGRNSVSINGDLEVTCSPAWCPDSQKIAFCAKVRSANKDRFNNTNPSNIYVVNADGSNKKQLTDSQGDCSNPDWSPDGRMIVYQYNGGIWIMNADGTGQKVITATGSMPIWSPLLK